MLCQGTHVRANPHGVIQLLPHAEPLNTGVPIVTTTRGVTGATLRIIRATMFGLPERTRKGGLTATEET